MAFVTSKDSTQIGYDKIGSGPAIIIVDGAMVYRASQVSFKFAELLKDNFTVYAYDRRGRGESGDTQPYAVEREIEDIEALIEDAGGEAYLVGFSSGAILALKAAHNLGNKVKGLVLYEPPLMTEQRDQDDASEVSNAVDEALARGDKDAAATFFMGRIARALQFPEGMFEGMKQSPMWSGMVALAPTMAYDNAVMGRNAALPTEASSIHIPTLVAAGGASPEIMHRGAKVLADAVPQSTYKILEGQTHEVKPEIIVPLIKEFFAA